MLHNSHENHVQIWHQSWKTDEAMIFHFLPSSSTVVNWQGSAISLPEMQNDFIAFLRKREMGYTHKLKPSHLSLHFTCIKWLINVVHFVHEWESFLVRNQIVSNKNRYNSWLFYQWLFKYVNELAPIWWVIQFEFFLRFRKDPKSEMKANREASKLGGRPNLTTLRVKTLDPEKIAVFRNDSTHVFMEPLKIFLMEEECTSKDDVVTRTIFLDFI